MLKSIWLFLIISLAIFSSCNSQTSTNVDVNGFEQGIAKGNVQLLDVRTPDEYQSGHLSNALLAN